MKKLCLLFLRTDVLKTQLSKFQFPSVVLKHKTLNCTRISCKLCLKKCRLNSMISILTVLIQKLKSAKQKNFWAFKYFLTWVFWVITIFLNMFTKFDFYIWQETIRNWNIQIWKFNLFYFFVVYWRSHKIIFASKLSCLFYLFQKQKLVAKNVLKSN